MSYVLIVHEVQSYVAWKQVFDAATQMRKHAGELSYQLLREQRDDHLIVHFSKWVSLAQAKQFFESDELVEIRRRAGVKAPQFIYLEEIEQGVLTTSLDP